MPSTPPPLPGRPSQHTHQVRIGQKFLLYGILFKLMSMLVAVAPKDSGTAAVFSFFLLLFFLAALVLSITGIFVLGKGFGYSLRKRIALAVLMFVPLLSLIVLVALNTKATSMLRAAGYKVGLLGAKSSRSSRRGGGGRSRDFSTRHVSEFR